MRTACKHAFGLLVFVLLFALRADAAFTRITGCANFEPLAGVPKTVACAVTPGATNRLIIVFTGNALTTATATIADSAGNTWNVVQAKFTQVGSGAGYAWYALANGTGATTVTITWSTNALFFCNLLVDVFSGNDTTSPLSTATPASAASGAPSSTITPADNNTLLWGAANDSVTGVGFGFTKGADDTQQDWSEYKEIAGGSGAGQTINFAGGSGAWLMSMAAIKPASGGATSTCASTNFTLLGVSCK